MLAQRWRPVLYAVLAVVGIWVAAVTAYRLAQNSQVTADKVRLYAESVNLSQLSGDARAAAIHKLARMMNSLSIEERRKARLERLASAWFDQMTEQEKAAFIDETMPTGFKQMLAAFEQLPEDKRHKAVDDALRRLREQQNSQAGEDPNSGTNGQPVLSPELQAKIRTIGLQTFYSQSSAQTKAELAPVLEELQRVMESGRAFRGR